MGRARVKALFVSSPQLYGEPTGRSSSLTGVVEQNVLLLKASLAATVACDGRIPSMPMPPPPLPARRRGRRQMGSTLFAAAALALALLGRRAGAAASVAVAGGSQEEAVTATASVAVLEAEADWRDPGLDTNSSSSSSSAGNSGGTNSKRKRRRGKASAGSLPLSRLPSTLEHLVAGTVGGVSGALVSYPLDTVRVRMQTNGKSFGPMRTASLLLKEAGLAGFYRGVVSPMVGTGVIKAAVFGGYGLCQDLVRRATGRESGDLSLVHLGAAAMGSGFVGSFVVTPVERVKVVMQAALSSSSSSASSSSLLASGVTPRGGGYANAWGCARGLVSEQGLRKGLFAGLAPTLLRDVPSYACYFATYEACKRILLSGEGEGVSRGAVMFKTAAAGALAGIAAWLPVYPADVIKSRMQSAGATGAGVLSTASLMWKTEGLTPFYRGLSPTLVRAMVNHAATFLVYEATMGVMRRQSGGGKRERSGGGGGGDGDGDGAATEKAEGAEKLGAAASEA